VADVKLTKNELRDQQGQLTQLQRYLPTLQLKKAMLQVEVNEARVEIIGLKEEFEVARKLVDQFSSLLAEKTGIDPATIAVVEEVHKRIENIAGVDVPYFESVSFKPVEYALFETPPWVDAVIEQVRRLIEKKAKVLVAEEKKAALEAELREVSIRVNLFEKILIPRCQRNIKKIKVFLGDQQLAAVSQAKVAKNKIEKRRKLADQEAVHAS
jgi:V/A-type H+-transporting ATPase subunit D